jgi:hypothetical protein
MLQEGEEEDEEEEEAKEEEEESHVRLQHFYRPIQMEK